MCWDWSQGVNQDELHTFTETCRLNSYDWKAPKCLLIMPLYSLFSSRFHLWGKSGEDKEIQWPTQTVTELGPQHKLDTEIQQIDPL